MLLQIICYGIGGIVAVIMFLVFCIVLRIPESIYKAIDTIKEK